MAFVEPTGLERCVSVALKHTIMNPVFEKYVKQLGFRGSECVLEFGSGSGALTRYLARSLQDGGRLTCVDLSKEWMKVVKRKTRRFGNIEYLQGRVMELPLAKGAYDAVVIHFVLHDVEVELQLETVNLLAETLREGGKIFLREPVEEGHGIQPARVREIMHACGLRGVKQEVGKLILLADVVTGVYEKVTE